MQAIDQNIDQEYVQRNNIKTNNLTEKLLRHLWKWRLS